MARLIDAMQTVTKLSARILPLIRMGANPTQIYNEMLQALAEAPTVDAVPVVRCKDCKQWGGVAFGNVCRRWSAPLAGMKNCTGPNDFCSYGERRTDGAKMDLEVKDA